MAHSSMMEGQWTDARARLCFRQRVSTIALASFLGFGIANAKLGVAIAPEGKSSKTPATTLSSPEQTLNAWQMPAFQLADLEGNSHSLADWKGSVILLNFWATWCAPCYYETRHLIRFQNRYGPKGLQVVGIGLDDARKIKNFARTLGVSYPLLVAEPSEYPGIMEPWNNDRGTLPYTLVIDRDGKIVHAQTGTFSPEALEAFVIPLLGAPEN